MKGGQIAKKSIIVLGVILIGKGLSFIRDLYISSKFGAGTETDAYFAANVIPSLIYISFLTSVTVLIVPTYTRIFSSGNQEKADLFVSKLLNIFFVFSCILSLLSFLFIDILINIIAPGFPPSQKELASYFGRILVLSFPLSSLTQILASVSNARNNIYSLNIIPVISAIVVILALALFGNYGIVVLAISSLFAFLIQLGVQIFMARGIMNYKPKAGFIDEDIKTMAFLVLPIFLGMSIDQISLLINSIISSNLGPGNLSAVNYAQRLESILNGTVVGALIAVTYPLLSKYNQLEQNDELELLFLNIVKVIILILLPIILFLVSENESIVRVIFQRGKFNSTNSTLTASIFSYYAVNVVFNAMREMCIRIFYIKGATKIPLLLSVLSILINISFSFYLTKFMGLPGLGLANVISTVSILIIIYFYFKFKFSFSFLNMASFFKSLLLPFCVIMVLNLLVLNRIGIQNGVFIVGAKFAFSIFVFYFIAFKMKQKELLYFLSLVKGKIGK